MDSKLIVITFAVLLVAVTAEENKKPTNPIIDFFEAPLKALRTRPGEAVAVFEPQLVKINGTNASTWSPGQVINNAASSITDWIAQRVPIGVQPSTTTEPDVIVHVQGVDKEQETKKKKKKEEENTVENNEDDNDDEEDTENDSDNDDGEVRDDFNYRPNAIGNIYRHGFRNGIHNNGRYNGYGGRNRIRIGFKNRYNNYGYRHRPTIYLNNYGQPMRTRLFYRPNHMAHRRPLNRRIPYHRRHPLHDMVSLTRPNSRPQQKVQIVYPSQIAGQLPILIPVQTMAVQSDPVIKKQKRRRKPVRRPPQIIANDEPTDDLGGFTYIPIPVQQIALANTAAVDPLPLQQILPQLQVVAQHTHTIQPQKNQQQTVLLEGEYLDDEDSNEDIDDSSERPPRPSRPNRPSRPQRRPNRPTRPSRPARPDRITRPTRPSQSEESEESEESDISDRPARPVRPSRPNRVDRFGRPVRPTLGEVQSDPWAEAGEDETDTKHKFDVNRQKPVLVRVDLQDNSFDEKPDIGQQALEAYSSYTNVPGSFLSVGNDEEEETEESDIQGRSDSKAQYYIPQRYFSLLGSDSYLTVSNNGRFLLKTGRGLNILDAKVEPTKEKEETSEVKPEVEETPEIKDELKELKTEDEMDTKTETAAVEAITAKDDAKESVQSVAEGTDVPVYVPAVMKEIEKEEMVSEKEKPEVPKETMEKERMEKETPQPTSTLAPEPTTTITTEKIQTEIPTTPETKAPIEAAPQAEVKTEVMVEKSQPEVVTDETNEKPSLIHKAISRVKSEVVHEKPNGHLIVKSDVVSDDKESTGRSRHFSRGSKRYQGQS